MKIHYRLYLATVEWQENPMLMTFEYAALEHSKEQDPEFVDWVGDWVSLEIEYDKNI